VCLLSHNSGLFDSHDELHGYGRTMGNGAERR